ncbi:Protein of unknown function [Gryllus bimaculatus]|nr:Protein of unknown function [Gryllus bimaculatus]
MSVSVAFQLCPRAVGRSMDAESDDADGCSAQLNPCSLHACPPGKTCYLQPVTCVAANCDPVPACKDPDYDYE